MRHNYDPEDMPVGICDDCGDACTARPVDMGIGSYEFWGSRGVHHDWQILSPCCSAEVVEGGVKLIERKVHKARKAHGKGIEPGDRYERAVYFHWRQDGPGWFTVEKRKLAA
jgi:hypothetical protein